MSHRDYDQQRLHDDMNSKRSREHAGLGYGPPQPQGGYGGGAPQPAGGPYGPPSSGHYGDDRRGGYGDDRGRDDRGGRFGPPSTAAYGAPAPAPGGRFGPPPTDSGRFGPPPTDGGRFGPPATEGGRFGPPATEGGNKFGPPATDGGAKFGPPSTGGGAAPDDTTSDDPVARARAIAAKIAAQAGLGTGAKRLRSDQTSKKIGVPVQSNPELNWMGLLLGPRGSNLKRMEEESGARIFIRGRGASKPGDAEEHEDLHVLIEAMTEDKMAAAERIVQDILFNPEQAMRLKEQQLRQLAGSRDVPAGATGSNSMPLSSYGPGSGGESKIVMVPCSMVGLVIGRGGENVKAIQARTGASLQIQRDTETPPDATERSVTITGSKDAVEQAARAVEIILEDRRRELSGGRGMMGGGGGGGMNEQTVKVPNGSVGLIIGRGGSTIKSIQDRTAANIQIPKGPDPDDFSVRTVSVTGPSADGVSRAIAEIKSLVSADAQGQGGMVANAIAMSTPGGMGGGGPGITVRVPDGRVGAVIGKNGATIQGIQARTNTRIQMPPMCEPGTMFRAVSVTGDPEGMRAAEAEINAIIAGAEMDPSMMGGMGMGGMGMGGMGMGGMGMGGMGMGGMGMGGMGMDMSAPGASEYAQLYQQYGGGGGGDAAAAASGGEVDQETWLKAWEEYYTANGMPFDREQFLAMNGASAPKASSAAPGTSAPGTSAPGTSAPGTAAPGT